MRTVLGWLLGWVVAAWVRSLRLQVIDRTRSCVADRTRSGGADRRGLRPWILVFWHGSQVPLLAWSRRRRTAVMVSWSKDGELQTQVMRRARMEVVRGSTSRGGARALVSMVRALRGAPSDDPMDAAFAVDGPRGPLGTVQPGALALARRVDGELVPLGSAALPAKVLVRAWDRMFLPLPFARAVVVVGPELPATAGAQEIADAIDDANRRAVEALTVGTALPVP